MGSVFLSGVFLSASFVRGVLRGSTSFSLMGCVIGRETLEATCFAVRPRRSKAVLRAPMPLAGVGRQESGSELSEPDLAEYQQTHHQQSRGDRPQNGLFRQGRPSPRNCRPCLGRRRFGACGVVIPVEIREPGNNHDILVHISNVATSIFRVRAVCLKTIHCKNPLSCSTAMAIPAMHVRHSIAKSYIPPMWLSVGNTTILRDVSIMAKRATGQPGCSEIAADDYSVPLVLGYAGNAVVCRRCHPHRAGNALKHGFGQMVAVASVVGP